MSTVVKAGLGITAALALVLYAATMRARVQALTRAAAIRSFNPGMGEVAARAFRPDVAPVDSGGECDTTRMPESAVTVVTASYPSRLDARTRVRMTFDSAGHLAHYTESRNGATLEHLATLTVAQADSARQAVWDATRLTTITLNWPVDQAMVENHGAGRPTIAAMSTVRIVESLPALGPIKDRVERTRRLCGV